MNALIQNLIKGENNKQVILQLLKALSYAIRLAQKNFENKNERNIIMKAIFHIGSKYSEDDDVIEKIALLFIEMLSISSYYDYIEDYFMQIMKIVSVFTYANSPSFPHSTAEKKGCFIGIPGLPDIINCSRRPRRVAPSVP